MSPFGGMASNSTTEERKESSVETKASKTSRKGASCADDSSETRDPSETGMISNSTDVVLFRPEARLNPDVLELIFRHLNFKELLAAELVRIHFSSKQN